VLELDLAEEMPLTVVATAAVGDFPEVEPRFILDLHTQNQDLRLCFSDPEPLRLLRRAVLALLRHAHRAHPVDPVLSLAFSRIRPTNARQLKIDFDDELPY
jgi:hypothetical protein